MNLNINSILQPCDIIISDYISQYMGNYLIWLVVLNWYRATFATILLLLQAQENICYNNWLIKTKLHADNVLATDFLAKAINEKWVGDVTFVSTPEGCLYLVVIIDLFSRKVVGYVLCRQNDAKLACDAFKMATIRRKQPKHLYLSRQRITYKPRASSW